MSSNPSQSKGSAVLDGYGGIQQQGPQLFDDVGDGQAAAFLDAVRHGQGGEHNGQVGFDGVAGAVEHGSGREVGLGHAKRLLDVPEVGSSQRAYP